jgi:isopropylmalate/homocitrate/citramalate synthase
MVRRVAGECTLPIAVHCHNDLGLATANSVAALVAGASGVQCSLLGIGERAGNACLEEVAVAVEVAWGRKTGLDLRALPPLAERVAALTGQAVMPGRPVVGRNAFLHESGLHTSGIVRDPATYEPFPPDLVGRERGFAVGKHSGGTGVGHVLARHGVELPAGALSGLLEQVKARGYRGTPLGEDELLEMARARLGAAVRTGAEAH